MRVITTRHSTTRIYCVMRNVNKQSYSEFVSAQQQHVFLYSIRNSLYQKGYLSSGGYGHNERKVPKSLLSLFRSGFRQFFRFDCVSRPSFAGCCSCMDIEHISLTPTAVGNPALHRNEGGGGSLLELSGDGNRVEVPRFNKGEALSW